MTSPPTSPVLRRRVFYLPGYDPFPPRRYRELYRREAAAQAAVCGYDIALAPADAPAAWDVISRQDGQHTRTTVEVLVWSDIVQQSFPASVAGTYAALARTAWIYLSTGALFRLMRLRKGPVIAALYPVAMLLAQAGLALLAGLIVLRAGTQVMTGERLTDLRLMLIWCASVCVAAGILRAFRSRDHRLFAYYLMHDFAYSASARGAYPAALSVRLDAFRDQVATAMTEEADEVLVVGHSSGAFLAITVLARLLREDRYRTDGTSLSLLTLGQVVPMKSFLPLADDLRRDLRDLGAQEQICWVDISAPGDGCSFALCDPVRVSGQGTEATRWPLVVSAAFSRTLSPDRWRALRWRFFRLHFQYLCAFDRPGDYDYFRITGGPLTLRDRYAGRRASPSRIVRPLSGYTSVAE